MKKYTTIFLDIDSITYELYKNRYMHEYTISMIKQILKGGLKTLHKFEVIALLGKKEEIGRKYLYKNRITFMKQVSKQSLGYTKDDVSYLNYLLKHYDRKKKDVLVVSGNPGLLATATQTGFDTCYFNLFNPNVRNCNPSIIINKLEELVRYCQIKPKINTQEEIIENEETKYHYYIDKCLIELLEQNNIVLSNYDSEVEEFLGFDSEEEQLFAITTDLTLAKFFKERGSITYFVNNHNNDSIDYTADYESPIEKLSNHLKKIIK